MSPAGRGPDLHMYDAEGRWCGGGPIRADITRAEAVARLSRFVARHRYEPGPRSYKWSDASGEPRPIPHVEDGGVPEEVFAGDARDRHLSGHVPAERLTPEQQAERVWQPDIDQQLAHTRWLRRCGNCEFRPQERVFGCPCCGRRE